MSRPTALVIEIDTTNYCQGHTITINGVQIAHRPYDGSDAAEVERDVVEALGAVLRRETGWAQEAPKEEWDD